MSGAGRRIVVATRNPGKLAEIAEMLAELSVDLVSASEVGAPEVEETGDTFTENARLKATVVARAVGELALADDSGLVVPALSGEPGVRSARYSEEGTDEANVAKLLAEIRKRGLDRPAAKFVCVAVLAGPAGVEVVCRGEVEGDILPSPRGTSGFGYDPVFYSPEIDKAFGEASSAEKASISHRGRAMAKILEHLRT